MNLARLLSWWNVSRNYMYVFVIHKRMVIKQQDIQRIPLFHNLNLKKANDLYFQLDYDNRMKYKYPHNH